MEKGESSQSPPSSSLLITLLLPPEEKATEMKGKGKKNACVMFVVDAFLLFSIIILLQYISCDMFPMEAQRYKLQAKYSLASYSADLQLLR